MAQMSSVAFQMSQLGYLVGVHVKPRRPDDFGPNACPLWKIDEICETHATLSPTGIYQDKPKMVACLNLKDSYAICNTKPQAAVDLSSDCLERNRQWAIKYAESQINLALNALSHQSFCDDIYSGVKVYVNPMAAMTLKDYGVGELVLVPATMSIKSRTTGEQCPERNIDLGQLVQCPPISFSLQAQVVTGKDDGNFIAPFWAVQPAPDGYKGSLMSFEYQEINIHIVGSGRDFIQEKDSIKVPVLVNTAALKEGDLLYYGKKEFMKFFVRPKSMPKKKAKAKMTPKSAAQAQSPKAKATPKRSASASSPKATPKRGTSVEPSGPQESESD